MSNLSKTLLGTLALFGAITFGAVVFSQNDSVGGLTQRSQCDVTTSSSVVVGDDVSATILSANSLRAWASIEQPINATSSVALSFNEGADAVLGQGFELTHATTTSPVEKIVFGLNTDFPYTGAVTGITNGTASTTVVVTECEY